MERKPPKPMTPFDSMVTPPYLYSLKLLLPYTPQSTQRFMAIYIKFLELRHTMEYFHGFSSHGPSFRMIEELKPFMEPGEKEMMEQMEEMCIRDRTYSKKCQHPNIILTIESSEIH